MMEKKETKQRTHSFVTKHPLLAAVLLALLALALIPAVSAVLKAPFTILKLSFDWIPGLIGIAAGVIVTLTLYKSWFRPEFSGMLDGRTGEGFALVLPIAAYWILDFAYSLLFEPDRVAFHMSGAVIETAVTAGVLEEVCFRGILICTLLRQWRKKDGYVQAAAASAIVFGLIHALNAAAGANPFRTVIQVFNAGFLGFFLAAVFIRSGSLWPVMTAHVLQDIIAIGMSAEVTDAGVITGGFSFGSVLDLVLSFILCLLGLRMLGRDQTERLRELWNKKWN